MAGLDVTEGRWRGRPVRMHARRVIVKLTDGGPLPRGAAAGVVRDAAPPGTRVLRAPGRTRRVVLQVPPGADPTAVADALAQRGDVEYAEPDLIDHATVVPNDTRIGEQWALDAINAYEAWDTETGGGDVVIGIIDSGISLTAGGALNHPDLSDAGRTVLGFDYIGDDSIPRDENAHGTHVAGTAAATTDNATGIAGMDWASTLYITRTLDLNGDGTVADFAAAMEEITDYALANGKKAVINYSAGGTSDTATRRDACEYASDNGMILCAATGNNNAGPVHFPAAYSTTIIGVIAVGATQSNGAVASYSNVGPEVTVVAPGSAILSTVPTYAVTDATLLDYEFWNGTSMATPHVTGVVALMWSRDATATNGQVKDRLIATAVELGAGDFNNSWGYGLIDAEAAVDAMVDDPAPPPVVSAGDIRVGATIKTPDFPAARWAQSTQIIANSTTTSPPGTTGPLLDLTWTAPATGRVQLIIGLGGRDGAGDGRVLAVPQTFEGTSAAGTPVVTSDTGSLDEFGVATPKGSANYCRLSRVSLLEGLTPGATYYTRHMHWTDTSGTADIDVRELIVAPVGMAPTVDGRLVGVPPAVFDSDPTVQLNQAALLPIPGSPEVGVYFIAPPATRGWTPRVLLTVSGGIRDNGAGAQRGFIVPEVYERDINGPVVLAANDVARGLASPSTAAGYWHASRVTLLDSGLVAGRVYYARVVHWVAANATVDFTRRDIGVEPVA